jgi:metallophosphoesterase (TIGR00282 family)
VGDVCGEGGLTCLTKALRPLKRELGVHFTVVNGENVSGVGLTPRQAEGLLDAGAEVITLGNHTWSKLQITHFLEDSPYILRPANYPARLPGRGGAVYDGPMGLRIGVLNLLGRVEMDPNVENPFTTADRLLEELRADVVLVDFHAEATSEKLAMGWYLDGRAQCVWGTHTHVPTADAKVLPKGTGHITDLGMTGPVNSILGIQPEISINKFLGGLPRRYEAAEGPCKMDCVLFIVDTKTRRCVEVRRVDWSEGGTQHG